MPRRDVFTTWLALTAVIAATAAIGTNLAGSATAGYAAWAPAFSDSFNDGDLAGWLSAPGEDGLGHWWVEDGRLVQDLGGDHYKLVVEGFVVASQSVEARLYSNGGYGGVVLWYQDPNHWVGVDSYPHYYGAGDLLVLEQEGGSIKVVAYPFSTASSTWYQLKVEANSAEGNLDVYLDGTYRFSHHVTTAHRTGLSGLASGNPGGNRFDDFELRLPAALSLVKTPATSTYSAVGQRIGYSYALTNTGEATLNGPFVVSDDKAGDESCPAAPSLAPGNSITCTASYTITQADLDAGSVTNTATATNGTITSNASSATVTAVQVRALGLVKGATPASYTAAGQVITYSYAVTNTGNVTLAGPFTVADSKVAVSCPATSSLAPGAAIACTASYTTTVSDVAAGSVTNIASASNGVVTSAPAIATVIAMPVSPPSITTLAGDGTASHCGDGGAATSACVGYPYGVARGAAGALVITMPNHHRVRLVSAAGTITTRAGTGAPGFCGDNGPAASACLNAPTGAATDAAGVLYVADTGNQRIRKVTTAGKISTVAGNGTAGFCGDGGKATSACLNGPEGVAVAPDGTLYIADRANHRIRKVSSTGTITTVAGNGTAGYCGDGGPATSACLNYPTGVAAGAGGVLFISDYYNHRVRKVDAGGTITTIAGIGTAGFCGDVGPATSACLNGPAGLSTGADGMLVVADYYNERVRQIDAAGTITTIAGNGTGSYCGDGGPATSGCLHHPVGALVESGGAVLVADHLNHRVRRVSSPMASVTLAKTLLSGCVKTTGKVTLSAPAPAGGVVVTLASDNPHATVPASLTFKAGLLVKSFTVLTNPVAANDTASITARTGGVTGAVTLTLKPMAPLSVTLLPNPVGGGGAVTGTVTLECAAGPGDIAVSLMSSKPAYAWPASPTLTIPAGVQTGTFTVVTKPVTVVTKPAIKATANGVTKSKTLIINP